MNMYLIWIQFTSIMGSLMYNGKMERVKYSILVIPVTRGHIWIISPFGNIDESEMVAVRMNWCYGQVSQMAIIFRKKIIVVLLHQWKSPKCGLMIGDSAEWEQNNKTVIFHGHAWYTCTCCVCWYVLRGEFMCYVADMETWHSNHFSGAYFPRDVICFAYCTNPANVKRSLLYSGCMSKVDNILK